MGKHDSALIYTVMRCGSQSGKCTVEHYHKDGHDFTILWEWNSFYGDICRQWIVDGNDDSGVRSRGGGSTLMFDCSNSLIGERSFEKNSITFETLVKPLGLPWREREEGQSYSGRPIPHGLHRSDLQEWVVRLENKT